MSIKNSVSIKEFIVTIVVFSPSSGRNAMIKGREMQFQVAKHITNRSQRVLFGLVCRIIHRDCVLFSSIIVGDYMIIGVKSSSSASYIGLKSFALSLLPLESAMLLSAVGELGKSAIESIILCLELIE